jgi:hypothetical protein
MVIKKASVKRIDKKQIQKKNKGQIGKFTGISLPLPEFPRGFEEMQELCVEIAKRTNTENEDLFEHKKDSYFSVEDVWGHIYNTNVQIDRLLYIVIHLSHLNAHLLQGFEDIDKIKTSIKQVDDDFQKHKPKLEYIDQKVQEHIKSEEKAKQIYG